MQEWGSYMGEVVGFLAIKSKCGEFIGLNGEFCM